jgi:CBS domain-containing protein
MASDRRSFELARRGGGLRRLSAFLWGVGLGTAGAYFADPRLGRQRRARAGDKLNHAARLGNRELRKAERDVVNRGHGWMARLRAAFRPEEVDDEVLVERVRAALGRACSHPSAVEVRVSNGQVVLEGPVLERDHRRILRSIRFTRGVRGIEDKLERHLHPDSVPGLHQARARAAGGGPRCASIMKTNVQTVRPEDSLRQAAEKMALANVGFLPVRDPSGRIVGTITDRDIVVRGVASGAPAELGHVGDVMTRQVVACRTDDPLSVVEELMAQNQVSRLIVTDSDGVLKGVISLSDLIEHESGGRATRTLRAVAAREAPRFPA